MLSFDGHDLETLFVCGDPKITILSAEPNTKTLDSRNGEVFIGSRWGASTVAFSIGVYGTALERRNAFSQLGAWLDVDEPKQLILPDTPDRYYLAIPDGSLDLERGIGGEISQLSFTLVDPIAYSTTETTITVPSVGSITFNVGGTAPTYLYRTTARTLNADPTTKLYGIRLDNQDTWCIGNGNSTFTVNSFDFERRTLKIEQNIAVPTLDSTWFALTPGNHTIEKYIGGQSSIDIKYRKRWY